MSQTPIFEEVRRAFGRTDRGFERRAFREEGAGGSEERPSRPVMLRGNGGRHRRSGD